MGADQRANALLRSRLAGLWVAVDVQHVYREAPHKGDVGTIFDLGARGKVAEAQAATSYAQALVAWLQSRGASVLTNQPAVGILTGPYQRRHEAANAWGAQAYLACHVNAGGGGYGLSEYMVGTPGQPLGDSIGAVLRSRFNALRVYKVNPLAPGQRGAVCVEFFNPRAPGLILEPFFGDNPSMQSLFAADQLKALGEAIGEGVAAWWEGRPKG